MPNGTVKFFNPGKGFGFITPDDGAKDVFVPTASITAAGVSILKAGQRVSFEQAPDGKGPKAVNLKVLEAAPAPVQQQPSRASENTQVTLYCDPSFKESAEVLAALRAAGREPQIVDYIAAPPTRDRLRELSSLLRGTDQSLVRRYDPLFRELRLDDRFISENEFWDAVVEHPSLINGPVVAVGARAAICRSKDAVKSFLTPSNANQADAGRKNLSARLLKLMRGEAVPASPAPAPEPERIQVAADSAPKKIKIALKPKAKAPAKTKIKAKPAPKKAKAKPTKKPAKKSRRA